MNTTVHETQRIQCSLLVAILAVALRYRMIAPTLGAHMEKPALGSECAGAICLVETKADRSLPLFLFLLQCPTAMRLLLCLGCVTHHVQHQAGLLFTPGHVTSPGSLLPESAVILYDLLPWMALCQPHNVSVCHQSFKHFRLCSSPGRLEERETGAPCQYVWHLFPDSLSRVRTH